MAATNEANEETESKKGNKCLASRRFTTDSIHGHEYYDLKLGLFKVPIYMTAVWEQFDKNTGEPRRTDRNLDLKYSREENITVNSLEKALSKLEKAEDSLAFNSGMSALSAVYLATLKVNDTILISKESYGTTQQLASHMEKFGIKTILAGPETEELIESINDSVKLVIVETITNPLLKVIDVAAVAKRCTEVGSKLVVDNTFASPVIFRPQEYGASMTLHSLTKYIAGHNDVIGGSVTSNKETIKDLWDWRRKLGNIMNPFEAFLIIRSLPTLKLRFTQQSKTAKILAEFLEDNSKIKEVYYPGLNSSPYRSIADRIFSERMYGGVLSFKLREGKEGVFKFFKETKIIKSSPSLGGTESLATSPVLSAASTMAPEVQKELGITEDLIRLSVGLEDVEDLKEDIEQAL
ncbi:MAG: cystathionine gamma-synthase family protein [Nitrososphaeria archaeon]